MCDQIWRNFTTLAIFQKSWSILYRLFIVEQNFEPTLTNLLCYLANFHCCKLPNIEQLI